MFYDINYTMSKNTNQDNLDDIMNQIENLTDESMQNATWFIEKTLKMSQWKCVANDCEGGRPIMNGCDLWCTICKADREGKRDLFYLINSNESTNSISSTPTVFSTPTTISPSPTLEEKESLKLANVTTASHYTTSQKKKPNKYQGQDFMNKNSNEIKMNVKETKNGLLS